MIFSSQDQEMERNLQELKEYVLARAVHDTVVAIDHALGHNKEYVVDDTAIVLDKFRS